MVGIDIGGAVLRVAIGGTIAAHGWNHAFGGGRLPGTARWFESIGIRPGRVHAVLSVITEVGAGVLLLLGLLTPFACAGVVGTMTVALVANHRTNGFFIFRPGEGYEYVLFLAAASVALGAIGPGRASLDHALDIVIDGGAGAAIAAGLGLAGAALLLATSWRPAKP